VPLDRPVDDDGPLGGHSRMSDLDGEPSEDFGRLGDLGGPHSSRAMPQSPLERLASEPFSVLDETPLSPGVARREFWRPWPEEEEREEKNQQKSINQISKITEFLKYDFPGRLL
jgi:hypothetical protein